MVGVDGNLAFLNFAGTLPGFRCWSPCGCMIRMYIYVCVCATFWGAMYSFFFLAMHNVFVGLCVVYT